MEPRAHWSRLSVGSDGPLGVWLWHPTCLFAVSRDAFWQLAGSLCGFEPARQVSGAAKTRERCEADFICAHLCFSGI